MKAFLPLSSLFSDENALCQVDLKLGSTYVVSGNITSEFFSISTKANIPSPNEKGYIVLEVMNS